MAQYKCTVCNWIYDESKGSPDDGFPPGTPFSDLPNEGTCPLCKSGKDKFELISAQPTTTDSLSYFGKLERSEDDVEPDLRSIFTKSVTGKEELSSMRTIKHKNLLEAVSYTHLTLPTN